MIAFESKSGRPDVFVKNRSQCGTTRFYREKVLSGDETVPVDVIEFEGEPQLPVLEQIFLISFGRSLCKYRLKLFIRVKYTLMDTFLRHFSVIEELCKECKELQFLRVKNCSF
jgi:hypothetical protein